MEKKDIRWMQRFHNFRKAMQLLEEALVINTPSDLETEGMIQRFEYTFELAWKTLKDYLEDKGFPEIVGSRDAIRLAFSEGIIMNGETWMEMITARNLTSHLYEQHIAQRIAKDIRERFRPCFSELTEYLDQRINV